MKPDLTLILPCFNESSHLRNSIEKIISTLDDSRLSYEIILIDDASRDNTSELIKTIAKHHNYIKYLLHKKNVGRGGTVQEGIMNAKGYVVGFIDVDIEVGPAYISYFVELIKNNKYDIVIGSRHYPFKFYPFRYFIRTTLSLGYPLLVKLMLNLPIRDTETGYKFFNREKILPVLQDMEDKHWFWDTEIITRSSLYGLKIHEEPVLFLRNKDKKSTVRLIPDIAAYLKALWKLKLVLHKQSSTRGILYNFPHAYSFFMRLIYGKNYHARYINIAKIIKPGSSIIDVCCGDCALYSYLKEKNVTYIGLDISPAFIWNALKKNIQARLFDLRSNEVPSTDYVVLQGSLYQFSDPEKILKKLYSASRNSLIISETTHTIAGNSFFAKTFLTSLGSYIVNTENKETPRFDKTRIKKLLSLYNPHYIENEKEIIAVIKKKSSRLV